MTERTCPACDARIEKYRKIGPFTPVLDPCGHQVDDRLLGELSTSGDSEK